MLIEKTYTQLSNMPYNNMSTYPNILTPPSSNEDSPMQFVPSPTSSSYSQNDGYIVPPDTYIFPDTQTGNFSGKFDTMGSAPFLHFVEQPTDRFRFRYKSEMAGTHGSLNGISSDKSRKQTFPTVELKNFNQPAVIRCSIYQNNAQGKDFMPHAHRLIKKHGKEEVDDPHDITVSPDHGFQAIFHSMGIIHTAKKNIVSELVRKKTQLKQEYIARLEGNYRPLTKKEEVEIKGLAESESKSINLNIVCLRFDAFIRYGEILRPICDPIYSHGINNLKSALTGELKIVRMDHCTSPAKGGREIFILVERVTKKNIKIRFYEMDDDDNVIWDDYGKFSDLDVHHQYAIVFKTPKYRDVNITHQVKVYIELLRPTDQARSEPKEFTYTPSVESYKPGAKRPCHNSSYSSYDSSASLRSDELPMTIHQMSVQKQNELITSEDLANAMANVDSDEFINLFNTYVKDSNEDLFMPEQLSMNSVAVDGIKPDTRYTVYRQQGSLLEDQPDVRRMPASDADKLLAMQTYQQLHDFIKTKPPPERIIGMLRHHFSSQYINNALHTFIMENNIARLLFILKLMNLYKQYDLLNMKNNEQKTPLHIAAECNNRAAVEYLLICNANPLEVDSKSNTALHSAVRKNCSVNVIQLLLKSKLVKEFIDLENENGDTALNIAVENNNIAAVKLLYRIADINKKHNSNGYTPLRLAIEMENVTLVNLFLSHARVNAVLEDFNGVTPLSAAFRKPCSSDILQVVTTYMEENGYSAIKTEIIEEPMSIEQEEDEEDEQNIKIPISPEQLQELYEKVDDFTPDVLEKVSYILDESGNCYNLAELLEIDHLLRSGVISTENGISKNLLVYAIERNKESVFHIRNFLENLDELKAVQLMDDMVRDIANKS